MSEEKQLPQAQKIVNSIISKIKSLNPDYDITPNQEKLMYGYYVKCSEALTSQGYEWENVGGVTDLSLSFKYKSRLGLDMTVENMLYPIIFKNKSSKTVKINLINGYRGEQLIRTKYALDPPIDIRTELVCENDVFKVQKTGNGDNYVLDIPSPENRGKVVSGFGYIVYENPRKNKIVTMSLEEMEERKPTWAKEEFWGRWHDKMLEKTLMKATCKYVLIDPAKADEYNEIMQYEEEREVEIAKEEADSLIAENANKGELIDCEL